MTTLATLVVKLVGDAGGYMATIDQVEKRTGGFLSGAGGLLKGFAVGAAGAFASAGAAAFASAMELDEAYDTIQVGTGATGEALAGLKDDFTDVFKTIPTDAQSTADVITELNRRLGATGPELQGVAAPLLEMTRLLDGDARTNAALFARVIGDWNLPLEDASTSLDAIFVASQKTGAGVDRLMSLVVQFGSPLRLMGFGFKESVALLAKWEKEGVNAELVMGSLRIAAGKFAREQKPLREGLLGTMEAITGAATKSEALAIAMDVFGARAGPDMAAAILEGRFAIDDLVEAMQNADGAIMATAEQTADFPEKFQIMKNKIETTLAPLGMIIMDGIGRVLDVAGPLLEQGIPVIIGLFQQLTTWLNTNIAPAFNQIVMGLQQAHETAAPIIEAIRALVMAVFGVIAQFVKEHGEEIKTFVQNAWRSISEIVSGIAEIVKTVVESVFGGIARFIQENQQGIKTLIEGVWNAIKTIVEMILGVIKGIVNAVLAALRGDWQTAWNAIKQIVTTVWEGIKNFIRSALDIIKSVLSLAWNAIKDEVNRVWTAIRTAIENAFNQAIEFLRSIPERMVAIGRDIIMGIVHGIESGAEAVWNALRSIIEDAIDGILRFLGLRSPSRLMADIGQNMMAGLAMGIAQGARLPELALNAAVGNVALSAGGGGSPAGNTITNYINFNTSAPLDATRDAATIRALAGAL